MAEALVTIEDAISEIQRGYIRKPSFYNDNATSSAFGTFMSGVNTALSFSGQISRQNELVPERNEDTGYLLTDAEMVEINKKAQSMSNYTNIPFDTCRDFLVILCFVDNMDDMQTIADAVQIPELADEKLIRNPMAILAVPQLEKIAFAASALDGLINAFRHFTNAPRSIDNKSNSGNDMGSILQSIGNILGGISNLAGVEARIDNGEAKDSLGNFLSELITGKRIPMSVIAKNPMIKSPSYEGKAYFGEAPTALANFDIDQLFGKKIAVFPQVSNGSGTSAFSFQNAKSFGTSMNLDSFVAKVLTGSSDITSGSKKERQVNSIVEQINTFTGSTGNETVEIRRADNAIPIMAAMSTALSGMDKSIFPASSFQEGWSLSNSVSNYLYNADPSYIEFMKRFV